MSEIIAQTSPSSRPIGSRPVLTNPAGVAKKRGRPKKEDAEKELTKKLAAANGEKAVRAKRSQAACQRCKTKKTKCDFNGNSQCCTRCAHDQAICRMGTRKKIDFKQLPPGYGEMVEDNHLIMAEAIISMYKQLCSAGLWTHRLPRLDDHKEPILHDIVTAMGTISQQTLQICDQLDIEVEKSFPRNPTECAELATEITMRNPVISAPASATGENSEDVHHSHSPASLVSDHSDLSATSPRRTLHMSPPATPKESTLDAAKVVAMAGSSSSSSSSGGGGGGGGGVDISMERMGSWQSNVSRNSQAAIPQVMSRIPAQQHMSLKSEAPPMTVNPSQLELDLAGSMFTMGGSFNNQAYIMNNNVGDFGMESVDWLTTPVNGLGDMGLFNMTGFGSSM